MAGVVLAWRLRSAPLPSGATRPVAAEIGRRLMTIPGVGPVTTLAYIATVDNPGRFANSKAHGELVLCSSVT